MNFGKGFLEFRHIFHVLHFTQKTNFQIEVLRSQVVETALLLK